MPVRPCSRMSVTKRANEYTEIRMPVSRMEEKSTTMRVKMSKDTVSSVSNLNKLVRKGSSNAQKPRTTVTDARNAQVKAMIVNDVIAKIKNPLFMFYILAYTK